MFAPTEFQSIRNRCLKDFETLLENLNITPPDWSGNEYRIYERLDDDITEEICALTKSPSIIEGYTTLLNLGGVPYNFSEIDNELLAKIVAHRKEIIAAVRRESEDYNSPPPPAVSIEVAKIDNSVTPYSLKQHFLKEAEKIFDVVVKEFRALFVSSKSEHFDSVDEFVSNYIEPMSAGEERKIVLTIRKTAERRNEETSKPKFTADEIDRVLKILTDVDKIIKKIAR